MGHILRCVSILYPQYAKIINLWRRGCLPIRMLLINQPEIEGRLLKLINVTDFEKKKKNPTTTTTTTDAKHVDKWNRKNLNQLQCSLH